MRFLNHSLFGFGEFFLAQSAHFHFVSGLNAKRHDLSPLRTFFLTFRFLPRTEAPDTMQSVPVSAPSYMRNKSCADLSVPCVLLHFCDNGILADVLQLFRGQCSIFHPLVHTLEWWLFFVSFFVASLPSRVQVQHR